MSVRSLNKAMIIGNLTRDPELRYTPSSTAVCTFGVATNRSWTPSDGGETQEETEYHRVVAWSKLAEICSQLLYKGRKIYCEGRLQTRRFTGQDGQERQVTEIVMEDMIALGAPKAGYSSGGGDSYEPPMQEQKAGGQEEDSVEQEAPKAAASKKGGSKSKAAEAKEEENQEVDVDDIPF